VIVLQIHDVVGAVWDPKKAHKNCKVLSLKRHGGEVIDIAIFEHREPEQEKGSENDDPAA
jgi:hypothetical protein